MHEFVVDANVAECAGKRALMAPMAGASQGIKNNTPISIPQNVPPSAPARPGGGLFDFDLAAGQACGAI
ncbi:MAG: hypothetical protein IPK16_33250 [Anaerolineales bacterium]|nr:hypothetical protein [Anaerolineales bacterium]